MKITEAIYSAPIIFRLEHPITLTAVEIRDFDEHNFWMENGDGEGMTVPKVRLIPYLTKTTNQFNKLFNELF